MRFHPWEFIGEFALLDNPYAVNERIGFDTLPLESNGYGYVRETDRPDLYAPEVFYELDSDGQAIGEIQIMVGPDSGWSLVEGFGHGTGPDMHPSEFIGGAMARYVLENPGVYVAVVVTGMLSDGCPVCGAAPDHCQGHGEIGDPDGAAILAAHDDGEHEKCREVASCDPPDGDPLIGWALAVWHRPGSQ